MKKKKAEIPVDTFNLKFAYDTCIQADIPVYIERDVLMTECRSFEEYSKFRNICKKIKNISYGGLFVD